MPYHQQAPEESIKFKATEDVIPTKESAEEVIPDHEEYHVGAPDVTSLVLV